MAACAAVGAVALVCYFRTLLPGVGFWDIGEFQTVAHVLGIAHPTGYPLYTLMGKLSTLWPFGTIATRLNGLSAVSAAVAAMLLTALALRLGVRASIAMAAGLAFALGQHVWRTATHADPHTLHVALVAALWLLVVRWRETRDVRWIWGLALLAGLSLGNHMLLAFELPALALAVLWPHGRSLRLPHLAPAVGCGLLGLSIYAYLPLRAMADPPLNYANPTTFERFRYLVLGEQFQGGMGFLSLQGLLACLRRLPEVLAWHAQWLSWPGFLLILALALWGVLGGLPRERTLVLAIGLGAVLPFYVASTYVNADLGRYYMGPTWLMLLLAALGAQGLSEHLGVTPRRLAGSLLVILSLGLVILNLPVVDASRDDRAARYERAVFAHVKPRAVILSWWSFSTPLWYGRFVEGRRPDVTVIDESTMVQRGWGDMATVARRFAGRPVYAIPPPAQMPALMRAYRLVPVDLPALEGQGVYELTNP